MHCIDCNRQLLLLQGATQFVGDAQLNVMQHGYMVCTMKTSFAMKASLDCARYKRCFLLEEDVSVALLCFTGPEPPHVAT